LSSGEGRICQQRACRRSGDKRRFIDQLTAQDGAHRIGLHLAAGGGDPPSYRDRDGVYLEKIAILELLFGLAP
jgi:hypothetical protein